MSAGFHCRIERLAHRYDLSVGRLIVVEVQGQPSPLCAGTARAERGYHARLDLPMHLPPRNPRKARPTGQPTGERLEGHRLPHGGERGV